MRRPARRSRTSPRSLAIGAVVTSTMAIAAARLLKTEPYEASR